MIVVVGGERACMEGFERRVIAGSRHCRLQREKERKSNGKRRKMGGRGRGRERESSGERLWEECEDQK